MADMRADGRAFGRRAAAFTLIEMVAVAVILAAILALAVPMVDRWSPAYRLRQAATAVESRLAAVRSLAMQHDRTYRVWYDLDKHETWASAVEHEGEPLARESLPQGVTFDHIDTPGGEIRSDVIYFEVHPSGRVDVHTVVLTLRGAGRAAVRTDPLCGAVRVETKEE